MAAAAALAGPGDWMRLSDQRVWRGEDVGTTKNPKPSDLIKAGWRYAPSYPAATNGWTRWGATLVEGNGYTGAWSCTWRLQAEIDLENWIAASNAAVAAAKAQSVTDALGDATDRELIYALARFVFDESKTNAARICVANPASTNALNWLRNMTPQQFKSNIAARLP